MPRRRMRPEWRLLLLLLAVLLALLRAERGVAELQGREAEPGRLFRLVPEQGTAWTYSFLGYEGRVWTAVPLLDGRPFLLEGIRLLNWETAGERLLIQTLNQVDRIRRALTNP